MYAGSWLKSNFYVCCETCKGWICNECINDRNGDEFENKIEVDDGTVKSISYYQN